MFNEKIFKGHKESSPGSKNSAELSITRILAMASEHPEHFKNFEIGQLGKEDFEIERRCQLGEVTLAELSLRQNNSALKESQRMLSAFLKDRIVEQKR